MSEAWDSAAAQQEKDNKGGGLFVRLEDGDSTVGVFVGDPRQRRVVWNQDSGRTEDFDPETNRAHRELTPKSRYLLNFFDAREKAMRVFELNSPTFESLLAVRAKYGLKAWSFEITRKGKGKDTTYSILPEEKIDDTLATAIAAAGLNDLKPKAAEAELPAPMPVADGGTDLPF